MTTPNNTVAGLAEKWRMDADGWYGDDFNRGRQAAALKHADELEAALASPTPSVSPAVEGDLVERFKVAARALIRERKVYGEDVETLGDVLRVLEAMAAPAVSLGEAEPAWQNIENAESEFLVNLADKGGLSPLIAGMLRHCARLLDKSKATTEQPGSAVQGEAVAWLANDGTGRVIDAKAKAAARRAGGATASAMSAYTIPLTTPPPAPAAEQINKRIREAWNSGRILQRALDHAQPEARGVECQCKPGDLGGMVPGCRVCCTATPNPVRAEQPEGKWKLVPVVPTPEMLAAYTALNYSDLIEFNYYGGMTGWDLTVTEEGGKNAWNAMLAAAPAAPVGVDELNASIIREAADLLTAVSDSGVQLPKTWRWPLIDELHGIAALAGKDGA